MVHMRRKLFAAAAAALALSMFSSTAALAAGWEKVSSQWFYYQEDGSVAKDVWIDTEDGRYWMRHDGVMAVSPWVPFVNHWY